MITPGFTIQLEDRSKTPCGCGLRFLRLSRLRRTFSFLGATAINKTLHSIYFNKWLIRLILSLYSTLTSFITQQAYGSTKMVVGFG
jgi:hypothetical protein